MDASRFLTATLRHRKGGSAIAEIMAAAVMAADPYRAVQRQLVLRHDTSGDWIHVGTGRYDLARLRRILVLALGKAATPMAQAAVDVLGSRVRDGLVIPKATKEQESSQVAGL
ncbi:MAG: hypothetical protein AVDCRST_MAG93-8049, partial [uncultured Chloroflexia bacterium]